MKEDALRVMIVDDHEVVREGLYSLLNRRDDMQVVAEAASVADAVTKALLHRPNVIVMDVRLPDGSGVAACRDIRAELPDTRVVMLTSYADDDAVFSSILAGASGYLLKQTRGHELADAVAAVARGESLLDPLVTRRVMERMRQLATQTRIANPGGLTEHESQILTLIAEGKTNREIGAEIFLSDKTVKNYVSSILSKLNMHHRAEAAAYIARREPQVRERSASDDVARS